MKIFSNFDTNIRKTKLKEAQDKFWIENVMVFGRSRLYRFVRVFFPTFFFIILNIVGLFFLYTWFDGEYFLYFVIAFILLDFVWIVPVLGKYIDYKMDFIVVTPDMLVMYDQSGLLKSNVVSTNEHSIKTITVKKSGLWDSIFNLGNIIFFTEWDTADLGEIILRWVSNPEKRKNQIAQIMSKDL